MLKSIALGLFINPTYCETLHSADSHDPSAPSIATSPVEVALKTESSWSKQLDALKVLAAPETQFLLKTTAKKNRIFQQIVEETEFDLAEVLKVYGVTRLEELNNTALRTKVERDLEAVIDQATQSALKFLSQEQQERLLSMEQTHPEVAILQTAVRR